MTLKIRGRETSGLIEIGISSVVFFSPNIILLFDWAINFKTYLFAYNLVIIFMLFSVIAHQKFNYKVGYCYGKRKRSCNYDA